MPDERPVKRPSVSPQEHGQDGGTGRYAEAERFPDPPSAFNLPAPPPPAVAQLTSSWGKDASPLVAPPEAQGAQRARPRRHPATPFLAALGSVVAHCNFSRTRQVK